MAWREEMSLTIIVTSRRERIAPGKPWREARYHLHRLTNSIDAKLFDQSDEITADGPRKPANNLKDIFEGQLRPTAGAMWDKAAVAHRRLADTLLKVEFRLVPTPLTAAMIAMAMHDAIRPYSMAVAPASSLTKCVIRTFMIDSF
jgi:hypothetical protein